MKSANSKGDTEDQNGYTDIQVKVQRSTAELFYEACEANREDPAGALTDAISPRIKSMKEVPVQLRKLRREYVRYQQAELIYSLSHKKLLELASDAGAIYRFDSTVLINRDIFDAYLERFHEPATSKYRNGGDAE